MTPKLKTYNSSIPSLTNRLNKLLPLLILQPYSDKFYECRYKLTEEKRNAYLYKKSLLYTALIIKKIKNELKSEKETINSL